MDSAPGRCLSASSTCRHSASMLMQVPSLAATLRRIAERCLPLPRVPAAAVGAAAVSDAASWREVETALRDLGGIAAEGAGVCRSGLQRALTHAIVSEPISPSVCGINTNGVLRIQM